MATSSLSSGRAVNRCADRVAALFFLLMLGGCSASMLDASPQQARAQRPGAEARPEGFAYAHLVETLVHVPPRAPGALRLAVYSRDLDSLEGALDPALLREVSEERIVLDLVGETVDHAASPAAYRAASFVVDYDTPAVEAVATRILTEHGDEPTPEQISDFVHAFIEPVMGRGFDFASKVARTRAGDCTEHAVLYAALARRLGYPARVVFGVAIVAEKDGTYQAYGHAWNEVATAKGWQLVDSTGIDADGQIARLPSGYLEDESAGYGRSFITMLNSAIHRVEILGSPVPSSQRQP